MTELEYLQGLKFDFKEISEFGFSCSEMEIIYCDLLSYLIANETDRNERDIIITFAKMIIWEILKEMNMTPNRSQLTDSTKVGALHE